ncbi:MAG TPA: arylsulfatase [Chloroflexota bacterium]|nr:arylsulfatase [Chloroflexota bacterium]
MSASGNPSARPNVVFVLTDDQGYGDLGCHGNPYIRTPHIDALHGQSVRFTNFHVGPTCSPTRAGLMTGHYANSTGVWHTIGGRSLLRQGERTIAERFGAAGYATALFGKWHLGDAYPYRPEDRGFQEVVTHGGGGVGNTPDYWGNNYEDDTYRHNGAWERYEGYCTEVWFREAGTWIERQSSEQPGQPFLCFVTPNAPHSPHIVPERYWAPYRALAERDLAAAAFFNYPQSDQMLRFYGMVTCIDEHVGRLRDTLTRLGLAENTIFIFMTDNGSAGGLVTDRERYVQHGFSAGMRGGKNTPYEGGHRVPFFLRWPGGGLSEPRDLPQLTANVDVTPTLLNLCGIAADLKEFHGRSCAPLLSGAASWDERAIVTDSQRLLYPVKWRLSCVMRQEADHEWRLINGRALYNLRADPEQRSDLAALHPEMVARLRDDYEAWWALVSPRVREAIPIPIGADAPSPQVLTAHDWRRDASGEESIGPEQYGDDVRAVWNQALVRQGPDITGYWELDVRESRAYRFELRRWPREAALALREGISGEVKRYDHTLASERGGYGGGRAIPLSQARIKVGGAEACQDIPQSAGAATFDLSLEPGPTHLETWLSGPEGELSAYYVYVEPL